MKRQVLEIAATITAFIAGEARAEWKRAETPHYVMYSEGTDEQLRDLGFRLEMLDKTQRVLTRKRDAPPTIKPIVYVLKDMAAVQATMPFDGGSGVAGYYSSTTRGPFMVTNRDDGDANFTPQLVMFHELTHYFMFENFPAVYPTWFTEGLAEFVGTSRVLPPNKMEVGRLSLTRYATLARFDWLPVSKLLAARSYSDVDNVYMLYAEGWLLTHYLTLGATREGQLGKYLAAINAGRSFADAAKDAFGDLQKLNVELQQYAKRRILPTRILEFRVPTQTEVKLMAVSPAQAALMSADIKLMAGIAANDASAFDAQVARIADRFNDDPFALRIRTEAALLADNRSAALTAARHWLAVAPGDPLAQAFLGRVEIAELRATASKDDAAWSAARARIASAIRKAPTQPIILRAYYDSFLAQKKLPPEDAQNMLYTALDQNPNDDEVRYELASDFEVRGMLTDAIDIIRIAAFAQPEKEPENDKDRQKQAKRREKYRLAGEEKHETPREMLIRLNAKAKAEGKATKADDDKTTS